MEKINIRGIAFDNVTLEQAVNRVLAFTETPGAKMVVTPNSEIVQICLEDPQVAQVVSRGDLIIPDGIGVVYASKILGTPLKQKVAGFDLAAALLPELEKRGIGLFLLGSAPGVAQEAARRMQQQYPELLISGTHDGYFQEDEPVIEQINESGAQVLFVCLGAPKQEKWMEANRDKLQVRAMLGLGGSLDVFAGNVKRAPDIYIKLGLEWLYRLMKEPWRYKRMAKLPQFLLGTIACKMKGKGG
ncbi:MAG: WecB/TagA/CpsF family glycosyltransferase [Eubacteriales bacterium]|jgi:N-acetylglucosaminyldiphosphoundecaprenol N-acetyl-beta-D-mannosaminyltransferase